MNGLLMGSVRQTFARLTIGLVVSALLCGGAARLFVPGPRTMVYDVVPTAAIDESSSTLGIADSNLTNLSTSEIDEELQTMQSLGIKNVRISIPWAGIEAEQGTYNWDTVDYIVQQATDMNIGILGVLSETPVWAGSPYLAGMPEPSVFANFAQMVATRYKGVISTYEIWNEPNAINFLDPVDPAAYTTLLQAAYPLIKAVDSSIVVIGGVVGAGLTQGNAAMNPVDFVQGMYDAGAKGFFDALSFHPYDYSLDFSDGSTQAGSPLKQLQQILQIMAANDDEDLKVWATEYGEPTTSNISEQQQADFLQDFLASWPTIAGTGPMFIYTLRDTDSGGTNPTDNLGLYYTDWTAKQAVQVIIDYLESLDPEPTNPNPVFQAITAAVQWLATATRTVIQGLAVAAGDVARAVGTAVKGLVRITGTVVKAVAQAAGKALDAAATFAASVVRGIVQAAKNVAQGISHLVDNVVNGIKQAVKPSASVTPMNARLAQAPAIRAAEAPAVAAPVSETRGASSKSSVADDVSPVTHAPSDDQATAVTADAAAATAEAKPPAAAVVSGPAEQTHVPEPEPAAESEPVTAAEPAAAEHKDEAPTAQTGDRATGTERQRPQRPQRGPVTKVDTSPPDGAETAHPGGPDPASGAGPSADGSEGKPAA